MEVAINTSRWACSVNEVNKEKTGNIKAMQSGVEYQEIISPAAPTLALLVLPSV
jgi:hypothetical protein